MLKQSLFAVVLVAGLFFTGCDKSSDTDTSTSPVDLSKIMDYPYSALTPEEQKVKLENESIELVEFGNALKSSSAIEALQNLGRLLDDEPISFKGKGVKIDEVEDVYRFSNIYGVYTWDASKRKWTETSSDSELKFVFPAKKNATGNNAVFSVKAVSSDIAVSIDDDDYYYDYQHGEYVVTDRKSTRLNSSH